MKPEVKNEDIKTVIKGAWIILKSRLFLALLGLVVGTQVNLNVSVPQISWRQDNINYQELSSIDAMQPDMNEFEQ